MDPDATEVLSSLLDGERVEPDDLARVLEAEESRAMLVDFVRLRNSMAEGLDETVEEEARAARLRGRLRARAAAWRSTRAMAAAAVLALAVFGAWSLGSRWCGAPSAETPPRAAREIRFEPGVDWQRVDGGIR